MSWRKLTPEEERVILRKGTEMPFTGEYNDNYSKGTYVCRQCESPLYLSQDKFKSGCAGHRLMMKSLEQFSAFRMLMAEELRLFVQIVKGTSDMFSKVSDLQRRIQDIA